MNLSNRIYTRKILFRFIYIYNFYFSILSKNIYVNIADKIDNIVKCWFDKIDKYEFKKYDFFWLLNFELKNNRNYDIQDYIKIFNVDNKEFHEYLSYIANNFIKEKDYVSIEYNFILKNIDYLNKNYNNIIDNINRFLTTFKFHEINSLDQAILLLAITEYKTYNTPKWVIIKEAMILSDTFSSNNNLVNAVLDKLLNL